MSRGTFWGFFWRHEIYFISYLERKYFGLLAAKNLWQGFQNINLRVQGNNFRNIFSKKVAFSLFFVLRAEKLRSFAKKFTAGFSKLQFTCRGEQFAKLFFKKFSFSSFCTLSEKFSKIGGKFSTGCAKTAFRVSRRTFRGVSKKIDEFYVTFVLWAKKNLVVWQKIYSNLRVHGNFLGKTFSKNVDFSVVFVLWTKKNFQNFGKISGQGFQDHNLRNNENILRQWLCWKNDGFSVVFVSWAK